MIMMKLNCWIAGQIKGLLEVLKTVKKNSSTSVTVSALVWIYVCLGLRFYRTGSSLRHRKNACRMGGISISVQRCCSGFVQCHLALDWLQILIQAWAHGSAICDRTTTWETVLPDPGYPLWQHGEPISLCWIGKTWWVHCSIVPPANIVCGLLSSSTSWRNSSRPTIRRWNPRDNYFFRALYTCAVECELIIEHCGFPSLKNKGFQCNRMGSFGAPRKVYGWNQVMERCK